MNIKAPTIGAFLLLGLGFCFNAAAIAAAKHECEIDREDERSTVARIFDGDTIQLKDGRRVRFIAMNAPERKHPRDDKPAEPFADEAYEELAQLLPPASTVLLRYDQETHDRYGRVLAHAFTATGLNIQAELIKKGLGAHVAITPNTWNTECYANIQKRAIQHKKSIWSSPRFATVPIRNIKNAQGFYRVAVEIEKIDDYFGNLYIRDKNGNGYRIDKEDRELFHAIRFTDWIGKVVVAQGWIYAGKRGVMMRVHHPITFEIND